MTEKTKTATKKKATKPKTYKKRVSEDGVEKKSFSEQVAERLIAALEAGTAPWQKPWKAGEPNGLMPFNPTTKERYKGINSLVLMNQAMAKGYSDTRWMTFKQASDNGANVRKLEKGTQIQYWSFSKTRVRKDENDEPVRDGDGKTIKDSFSLSKPFVKTAWVFNAEQIDGLPELVRNPAPEAAWGQIERADRIIAASGAIILNDQEDRAFYRPSTDKIHMPGLAQFPEASDYYAVLFHEVAHWSGSKARLNRDLTGSFGSESYAREELRAEIASLIIGDELGLGHNPDRHASYVQSWIKTLKEDPLEIFRAASDAEKIQKFIFAFDLNMANEDVSLEEEDELNMGYGT
jgi:putative DNA primase/helicase